MEAHHPGGFPGVFLAMPAVPFGDHLRQLWKSAFRKVFWNRRMPPSAIRVEDRDLLVLASSDIGAFSLPAEIRERR